VSSITALDAHGRPIPKGSKTKAARYRARYRTPDGDSRSRTFERKADAERFLTATDHTKLTGEYVDQVAGRTLFGVYSQQWADAQPHRPTTAASVEQVLRVHILPTFGHRHIASIRTSEVQAWVAGLPVAPSTVRVIYGKLAAIFAAAVEDRLISRTPCTRRVRLPRLDGGQVVPMTAEQVRTMAEAVSDRYRALVVVLAGTGLRPAEALGLSVDRVDFLRRTIRVDRQLVTVAGDTPTLAPTKTETSVRTIPAGQLVLDELATHLARYQPGPDGLIFTDSKGDPIRRSALGHLWRRAARPSGLGAFTPHDLRHYAASVLIDQGASVKAVQHHLGHASATTTLDVYAHLWPDSEDVTRRALDAGIAHVVSPPCHDAAADG
jgi:integrase